MPSTATLCGISDEAGPQLADQIRAHQLLGWDAVELRSVGGVALADLDAAAFAEVRARLAVAGLRVSAVASRIGNWERPITARFEQDTEELRILAERMHALGARYLRIMSYPNDGLSQEGWREEALWRVGRLVELAARESITLVHENCVGWAAQSAQHSLALLEAVNSPALRLVFDTGNPVAYGYDGLAFLRQVLPWVAHVHVKDAARVVGGAVAFTAPGVGAAALRACVAALLEHGYAGCWSIEPHLHLIPHLHQSGDPVSLWRSYVDYGRQFADLIAALAEPGRGGQA